MTTAGAPSIVSIHCVNLDQLDADDLADEVARSGGDIEFVTERDRDGAFGEPVTIVAILALAALRGFTAWLALRQRNDRIRSDIEYVMSDGTRVVQHIDIAVAVGEDNRAKVVDALLKSPVLPSRTIEQLRNALGE